jgi:hypothetical protein
MGDGFARCIGCNKQVLASSYFCGACGHPIEHGADSKPESKTNKSFGIGGISFVAMVVAAILLFAPVNASNTWDKQVSCGSVMNPDNSHYGTECGAERNTRKMIALVVGAAGAAAYFWSDEEEDGS